MSDYDPLAKRDDDPPAPGWWLASDGNYYPPQDQQGAPPPPPSPYGAPTAPYTPYGATPQGPYAPYGGGYAPVMAPRTTNGLSIAAMVLGILWLYWIGSILALVFGYVARGQIKRSQGQQGGDGMAIAGIVLGWIGLAGGLLFFILFVVLVDNIDGYCDYGDYYSDPDC